MKGSLRRVCDLGLKVLQRPREKDLQNSLLGFLVSGDITPVGERKRPHLQTENKDFRRDNRLHRSCVREALQGTRYVGYFRGHLDERNSRVGDREENMFLFQGQSHSFQDLGSIFLLELRKMED